MEIWVWVILGVLFFLLVVVGLVFVGIYNGFVKMTNRVKEAWSDIDVQLKRRYDLIPNLVNTVKGYATHEQGTLSELPPILQQIQG